VTRDIDADASDVQIGTGVRARAAAQQCTHACQQLGQPERLGDIVVGTGIKSHHKVDLVGARGQHQDRDGKSLLPDPPRDIDTVDIGQAKVEDDKIGVIRRIYTPESGPVPFNVITFSSQSAGQRF
jgi:hypothetical protein